MNKIYLFSILLIGQFIVYSCNSQTSDGQNSNNTDKNKTPFIGAAIYKISPRDTSLRDMIPESQFILISNDTIVRTESATDQLGLQITLRHIKKNKSILLLNTEIGNFAIQTDLNKTDSTSNKSKNAESRFTFKKKIKKRKICGKKANVMEVSHPTFEEPIEFLYFKDYSNKYTNFFPELPGLPVRFSVVSIDGILDYELIDFKEFTPEYDLFGVPEGYEASTFDEFIAKWLAKPNSEENTVSPK